MNDLLSVHREHLERQRKVMNLVGPGDIEEHYEDSEAAIGWLEPHGHWADLGSGAGFPGIVLAARFPHLEVDLVESRLKRCVFLEQVVLAAGETERIHILRQRVEDLAAHTYDGIVARAFAPPETVATLGRRLLRPGGTLVLFLQGDALETPPDGYTMFHVEHYRLRGRPRKALALHLTPIP